ncbi:MAG: PQQ-binding-like beta-propeller repeat protein [Gemmatimonadota bacterium]|nr:PQQ-binding-like beta-propeller repeat protein [Gemmatimonadota bacterium]
MRTSRTHATVAFLASLALAIGCVAGLSSRGPEESSWPVTGGDPGNSRYSSLSAINRDNVAKLQVAWVYHTGDGGTNPLQIQATPIIAGGVLYATSGAGRVFALHAETGRELWRFDPPGGNEGSANRGVVYWQNDTEQRIFYVAGSHLYALDPATGALVTSFGTRGSIDLAKGLGRDSLRQSVVATSPGVIYKDLLIQGSRVGEGDGSAPGHVRAFDVRTGQLRWMFHTIPQPGEYGYDTWPADAWRTVGGANSWAGMSLDVARGIVYIPTGSATPDFYGGNRLGANLFANSLLALDAATGKRIWHFQVVHHDVLDRDLPAAPNLLTVTHDGRSVDAVAQITKSGFVFLFDRVSGAPIFPVEERAVPQSDIPGEKSWPTQPFPTLPAPFGRQRITLSDLPDYSPQGHAAAVARLGTLRNDGPYTPPSLQGSIVFPGFDGGGEWGGAAVDRESGVLYVNANQVPNIAALAAVVSPAETSGSAIYQATCASCHGATRRGDGVRTPSLVDVATRLAPAQIRDVVDHGRGFMPSFASLPLAQREAVTAYIISPTSSPNVAAAPSTSANRAGRSPYRFLGYEWWRDSSGLPNVKPPWGTLNAIDLNTGNYLWTIPLGDLPELKARGITGTGAEGYGGPIVTAGGLVFIGATQDEKIRALDKRTGAILWEAQLPAAGYATPSTYMVNDRQYVVIAAGGGKLGTRASDTYVAFALPR